MIRIAKAVSVSFLLLLSALAFGQDRRDHKRGVLRSHQCCQGCRRVSSGSGLTVEDESSRDELSNDDAQRETGALSALGDRRALSRRECDLEPVRLRIAHI